MRKLSIKHLLILIAFGAYSQANAECPSVEEVKKALQTYTGWDLLQGHLAEHFGNKGASVWLSFDKLKLDKVDSFGIKVCVYSVPAVNFYGNTGKEMTVLVLADK